MALRLNAHKCKLCILSDGASAMIFQLHRPEGATRSILLRSDRFALSSPTTPLLILVANALLHCNEPELIIEGITSDVPAASFPSVSTFSPSQGPRSTLSPPFSGTVAHNSQTAPLTNIGHAQRKAEFESEFGIGGVRVVGEGVTQDSLHPYLELETASGSLILYGDEMKWLEGRELMPIAGKFSSETLLEVWHIFLSLLQVCFAKSSLFQ